MENFNIGKYDNYIGYDYSGAGNLEDTRYGKTDNQGIDNQKEDVNNAIGKKGECQTCKNRKYQDGSDENVSFKAAAHVSPEAAGSAVRGHEAEHVKNAYVKASEKNGEVISASVSIKTSTCPECGRVYVSGGTTTTMIKYNNQENPYQKSRMAEDAGTLKGRKIDANT